MLTPDLRAVARQAMIDEGFDPDFGPDVRAELQNIGKHPDAGAPLKDLRALLWSSIDNDDTKDLDQIEFAEEISGTVAAGGSASGSTPGEWRLYIAISDVDCEVPKGSAIDAHAAAQRRRDVDQGVERAPRCGISGFGQIDIARGRGLGSLKTHRPSPRR